LLQIKQYAINVEVERRNHKRYTVNVIQNNRWKLSMSEDTCLQHRRNVNVLLFLTISFVSLTILLNENQTVYQVFYHRI